MGKPLPPPPGSPGTPTAKDSASGFGITKGRISGGQRIVVYGPGGIGKSTLASLAPNPVFIDLQGGTRELDVSRFDGIETFSDIRRALQSKEARNFSTTVLDNATDAQIWALAETLATVPNGNSGIAKNIESYGYGKGYRHLFDTFMLMIGDLDRLAGEGHDVILLAHSIVALAPNPEGEDFQRYELNLQDNKSGPIRQSVFQWADHVIYVGYDVSAADGKGRGSGTRTLYTAERPDHVAKSRRVDIVLPFEGPKDGRIWDQIIGGKK